MPASTSSKMKVGASRATAPADVPGRPMQRILYAVYRDEAAFDRHERQPYIRQFEEEREPYVLATNVIELGVRYAKFMPLAVPRQPRARKVRPRGNSAR